MSIINQEIQLVADTVQLATDYKYINAKGGRIGVTAFEVEGDQQFTVIHVVANQFHPDPSQHGNNTKVVQCALASIELDAESAHTLYELLGGMLKPKQER